MNPHIRRETEFARWACAAVVTRRHESDSFGIGRNNGAAVFKILVSIAPLLCAACAYDQLAAVDRCAHAPGCVSSLPSSGTGPIQQRAIEPTAADLPR